MLQIKNTLGGGKPEGIYIWKKCEYIPEQTIVNPTFHIKANVSTQKATITSDDINFKAFGTLTDSNNFYQSREPEFCNFMNGFNNSSSSVNFAISTSTYSGQLELNYSNNSYWNAFTKMTPTDTGAELTASNIFKTTIDDTLQYTGTKTIAAMIGEFISYVVSDKETAYPDGGEKGGYWYARVSEGITPEMFGCTKMEIQEYIPTSTGYITGSSSHLWNHSLGVTPKVFMIIREEASNLSDMLNFYIGGRVNGAHSPALASSGANDYSYGKSYAYECHMSTTLAYLLPFTSSSSYEIKLETGKKYRIIFMA